jgi:hypothetical protein
MPNKQKTRRGAHCADKQQKLQGKLSEGEAKAKNKEASRKKTTRTNGATNE